MMTKKTIGNDAMRILDNIGILAFQFIHDQFHCIICFFLLHPVLASTQ